MSYRFCLYRAAAGTPPLLQWERNHAEPLGSRPAVRARIDAALPGIAWAGQPDDGMWVGELRRDDDEWLTVSLHEHVEPGVVHFVDAAALPPVLRRLMSALSLTHCCAQESGERLDPFAVGARWGEPRG